MIKSLSIIVPTYHMRELIMICLKSFEKFCPADLQLKYLVIENSDDTSYKQDVIDLIESGKNSVVWINNNTEYKDELGVFRGAEANAQGVEIGMQNTDDEWVFLAHADVCVTNNSFFSSILAKVDEGNQLVGTRYAPNDSLRRNYFHISGYLIKKEIAMEVNLYPKRISNRSVEHDVGDAATIYCREKGIKHYCFKNTSDFPDLINSLPNHFRSFRVDKCVDSNGQVIFMHLSRGTPKKLNSEYFAKAYPVGLKEWTEFCDKEILG